MNDYVAWLNGVSVARGTRRAVEARAREIFASERWQEFGNEHGTVLRITRGARQLFAASYVLSDKGQA